MILKGISVNQNPPTKDYLWITPKGNARFWDQSNWRLIGGSGGGGGGGDLDWSSLINWDEDLTHIININYLPISLNNGVITIGNNSITPLTSHQDISGKADKTITITGTNGLSGGGTLEQNRTIGIDSTYKSKIDEILSMFELDSNGDIKTKDYIEGGVTKYRGFYSPSFISALGLNSSGGGGGGMDETALWQELTDNSQWAQGDDKIINISHLPNNINADTVDGYHANSFALADGTNATGTWGIGINGNAATATTATKATQDADGNTISSTYLKLSGGTMASGSHIDLPTASTQWKAGRDSAVIRTTASSTTAYYPFISAKTGLGSWDIGTYQNESLHFSYITDEVYNGSTNTRTGYIIFKPDNGGTVVANTFDGNATTATTATKATQDGNGNTISSTYLPLAGGTMTGNLNLKANQYNREGALNCNNSDIINVNSILTSDLAESFGEGLCFYRSASTWDCMSASNGTFYFGSNKAYGAALAGDAQINCGYVVVPEMIYNSGMYAYGLKCGNNVFGFRTVSGAITGPHILSNDGNLVFGNYIWDHNHWCTLHYTYNTTVDYLSFMPCSSNKSLNIGIGTNSPAYKLDVNGKIRTINTIIAYRYNSANNLPAITMDKPGSNYVGIGADGTSNRIKFGPCTNIDGDAWVAQSTFNSNQWFFQGYIHATNGIDSESYVTALATNSSDKRLKKKIKPFNAKQIIDKLSPVEFEWNKKANKYNSNLELKKKNYGLIAQDSDNIIDDFVFNLPDGKGYKGVRYEKLIPILLQAIKEQNEKIEDLEYEINVLKGFYK